MFGHWDISGSSTLTIFMVGIATVLYAFYIKGQRNRYPAGPLTLPLIGNLHQIMLSGSIVNFCEKYRKKYGNVFSFEFGGNTRVVISGYDTMYELLLKNADYTSSRSTNSFSKPVREDAKKTPGIFWAPPSHWKAIRSFSLISLRDGGMGKAVLEPQIAEEIEQYLQHFIEPCLGTPTTIHHSLPLATSNIITQLLFGKQQDYEDETFVKMMQALREAVDLSVLAAIVDNIPFANWLMGCPQERDRAVRREILDPMFQRLVNERKQALDPENLQCLIDRFLVLVKADKTFKEENGSKLSLQLYVAGVETTASTILWMLLYMCQYPHVKVKVQREIDENIGQRPATYKDHLNMPYTDAVILETLRISNVLNSSLPHTVEKDLMVCGKLIPAGSDLLLNMASVLYDEKVFEEPSKFKPERYLTGDISLKKQRTIPFGIGRRACLGESLAKVELFLFFVNFLQKYDIKLPEGSKVTMDPVIAVVSSPKPYELIFTTR